nr:hypothetical protein HmN_001011300 [Hymenolepis microstoma]
MNDQENISVVLDKLLQNLDLKIVEYLKSNTEPEHEPHQAPGIGYLTALAINPSKRPTSKTVQTQSIKPGTMTTSKPPPSPAVKPSKIPAPVPALKTALVSKPTTGSAVKPVPVPMVNPLLKPAIKTSANKDSTTMATKVTKSVSFAHPKTPLTLPGPPPELVHELEQCLITIAQYINPNLGDCLQTCVDQNYEI